MIVTQDNLDTCLAAIASSQMLSIDTETTGLNPWDDDELFAIIISTNQSQTYYFNFNDMGYNQVAGESSVLPRGGQVLSSLRTCLFQHKGVAIFMHNAKYDLAFLEKFGLAFHESVVVWCTMSMVRLDDNETMAGQFNLAAQAARIGLSKDDGVETWFSDQGIKKKDRRYQDVPFETMYKYGCKDAEACLVLGMYQFGDMLDGKKSSKKLYKQETDLTKVIYKMESLGVVVDKDYCEQALATCEKSIAASKEKFKELTGFEFLKSGKVFAEVFKDIKDQWVYTEKGNPSFTSKVLNTFKHPAADIIRAFAYDKNKLDFFKGFLELIDSNNVLHASFNQHGTRTGRFSSSKPNLQNLKRSEENESDPVRRAIVPRPDMLFAFIDYKQMEYRLALDLCDSALIPKIIAGHDIHQATGDVAGVSRSAAKTVNFLTIYGGGIKKLASDLGVSEALAKDIQSKIFGANPEMQVLIDKTKAQAASKKNIKNCMGRYYDFSDPNDSYKAPNTLIQGGCADIIKKAMVDIHEYLSDKKTNMVLTIHDEIVFEFPREEINVINECAKMMIAAYEHRKLPMDVDIEWSDKSLGDKKDWSCI